MPRKDKPMTLREAGRRSWTSGAASARQPTLDERTREAVLRIREKQARGEEITTEEAGLLGGVARVEQMQARALMRDGGRPEGDRLDDGLT